MTRIPIWVSGEITVKALTDIFNAVGFHVHTDSFGRIVADPIPLFLRKDEPKTNVVRLPTRARKVAR